MTLKTNNYRHIESFEDFKNAKTKLHFQMKLSEKKLEFKYLELTHALNPINLIPKLLNYWLSPLITNLRNIYFNLFRSRDNDQAKEEKNDQ